MQVSHHFRFMVLLQYGVLAAGKALMSLVALDWGPVRSPVRRLTEEQKKRLFPSGRSAGNSPTGPGLARSLTEVFFWNRGVESMLPGYAEEKGFKWCTEGIKRCLFQGVDGSLEFTLGVGLLR